jgi:hypothetical protein
VKPAARGDEDGMIWLLLLNTLIEGASGVAMIASPATFFPAGDALAFSVARTFGVAMCAIAVLSAATVRFRGASQALMPSLVTLAAYHAGQLAVLVPSVRQGFSPAPVLGVHAVFALAFIAAAVRTAGGRTAPAS